MKKLTILLIALLTATSAFLFFACGESSYNSRYEIQKCDMEYFSPDERTLRSCQQNST